MNADKDYRICCPGVVPDRSVTNVADVEEFIKDVDAAPARKGDAPDKTLSEFDNCSPVFAPGGSRRDEYLRAVYYNDSRFDAARRRDNTLVRYGIGDVNRLTPGVASADLSHVHYLTGTQETFSVTHFSPVHRFFSDLSPGWMMSVTQLGMGTQLAASETCDSYHVHKHLEAITDARAKWDFHAWVTDHYTLKKGPAKGFLQPCYRTLATNFRKDVGPTTVYEDQSFLEGLMFTPTGRQVWYPGQIRRHATMDFNTVAVTGESGAGKTFEAAYVLQWVEYRLRYTKWWGMYFSGCDGLVMPPMNLADPNEAVVKWAVSKVESVMKDVVWLSRFAHVSDAHTEVPLVVVFDDLGGHPDVARSLISSHDAILAGCVAKCVCSHLVLVVAGTGIHISARQTGSLPETRGVIDTSDPIDGCRRQGGI